VNTLIHTTDVVVLTYFLALNTFYALLLVLAIPEIWEQTRLAEDEDFQRLMQSDALPPITILVPAYNESATIETSVTAILTLEYRNFEIVVVNDGSKDDTMERLRQAFELYEVPRTYAEAIPTQPLRALYRSRTRTRLLVVDKENGGKADSLNAAINASRFPLVIAVDADTLIEPDALLRLTRPFLLGAQIAAVGGTVRVANGCTVTDGRVTDARVPRAFLPGIQVVEYLRAFLSGRIGWSTMRSLMIISGAFGLYRKSEVVAVGGYDRWSQTEDLELVLKLHENLHRQRRKYRIVFVPDPVCWTEVPSKFRVLARQRNRWHRGLVQSLWRHRRMMFNPKYGVIGSVAMPYFIFFELFGPFIEVMGYITIALAWALGLLNLDFFLLFTIFAIFFGIFLSVAAVMLEEISFRRYPGWEHLAMLVVVAVLENFGYRQLLSVFKVKAFWDYLWRRKAWGRMEREGFQQASAASPRSPEFPASPAG